MPTGSSVAMALMVAVGMTGCGGATVTQVPDFPLSAMAGPHAHKVKIYVNAGGAFAKYAVFVDRAAIPDWAYKTAVEQIGPGVDLEYEIEEYLSGAKVYEITRQVGDRRIEAAIRHDGIFLYSETKAKIDKLDTVEALPLVVREAVAAIEGFKPTEYAIKQGPLTPTQYKIKGMMNGEPQSVGVHEDGRIESRRRVLPGEIEIGY